MAKPLYKFDIAHLLALLRTRYRTNSSKSMTRISTHSIDYCELRIVVYFIHLGYLVLFVGFGLFGLLFTRLIILVYTLGIDLLIGNNIIYQSSQKEYIRVYQPKDIVVQVIP